MASPKLAFSCLAVSLALPYTHTWGYIDNMPHIRTYVDTDIQPCTFIKPSCMTKEITTSPDFGDCHCLPYVLTDYPFIAPDTDTHTHAQISTNWSPFSSPSSSPPFFCPFSPPSFFLSLPELSLVSLLPSLCLADLPLALRW